MNSFLETERLILKASEPSDLPEWILMRQDPAVMQYIGKIKSTQEITDYFNDVALPYHQKYGIGFRSVFEKSTGTFIGQAGLFHPGYDDTQAHIEVAYRYLEAAWGKGYATEVAAALVQWGFANLTVDRLVGFATPDNIGSNRVLTKIGMHVTHQKTNEFQQLINCYEILK